MNRRTTHRSLRAGQATVVLATLFAGWIGSYAVLFAQGTPPADGERPRKIYRPLDQPIIQLNLGSVSTFSNGRFPSLIVGESVAGSGEIPADYAESGSGYQFGISSLIPFSNLVGLHVELASRRWEVKYRGDSVLLPTSMEIQSFVTGIGAEISPYTSARGPRGVGLRAVFVRGGFEFVFGPLADRVTSASIADSTAPMRQPATGSFSGGDAFTIGISGTAAAGVRAGLSRHIELAAQIQYALGLNDVFSSSALPDNDLSVDHLLLISGFSYRF